MEKIKEVKHDLLTHAVCILFLVYTVFRVYELGGVRIADIADYVLIFTYLLKGRINNNAVPRKLKLFFCFWILSIIISAGWTGLSALRPLLGVVHSYLFYLLLFDKTDVTLLLKYYRIFAIIAIIFFFLQEFTYITIGTRISGIIPGLNLVSEVGDSSDFVESQLYGRRSSSFFSEPAHLAQFLLPLLSVELLGNKVKKFSVLTVLILLALLILQSGNAMFGLVVILSVYIVKRLSERKSIKTILGTAFIVAAIGVGAVYYISTEKGQALLDRQDQLSMTDYESGASGFVRIYRGYFVYKNLNVVEKIIGVNDFGVLRTRIKTSEVGFMFDEDDTYFNAVQYVMIHTGIIGLLLFVYFLADLWRNNTYMGKSLIICLIVLSFISSIFMTSTMALFLVLTSYSKRINKIT